MEGDGFGIIEVVERIANKSKSFQSAAEWDIQQHVSMSPEERMRAALALKRRAYPNQTKDVRECHRSG